MILSLLSILISVSLVLSVELPTGVADLELPSGLTTVLSVSDVSFAEPRNLTMVQE